MIKSQMISFRADNVAERDISQYISLIEQVYASLKQSSNSDSLSNLNNVASSIRQVVLKNDCLQQKNDILDFFFLCEKQINNGLKKQTKKINKEPKSWTKIVQKNLNSVKGLQNLYMKLRHIQLKRGFNSLVIKNEQHCEDDQDANYIDPSTIEVEQEIRLKTLYFFRWSKFIEYGKSIKKLRLKQIDDLRKSLTFNQYAVKFSYFHNWRKTTKMSTQNKENFNQIQLIQKKSLFNLTINSFYGLFEIKKIEEKLCQKVKTCISNFGKLKFIKKLSLNVKNQQLKAVEDIAKNKIHGLNQLRAQKMKYQCLFYFGELLESQNIKSKTLFSNFKKSQLNHSILCAKVAFLSLKNQLQETKSYISNLNEKRKSIILNQKFKHFKQNKNVKINKSNFETYLVKKRLSKTIKFLTIFKKFKSNLTNDYSVSTKIQDSYQATINTQNLQNQSLEQLEENINPALFQDLELLKNKHVLNKKILNMKISEFLIKIQSNFRKERDFDGKISQSINLRKNLIFQALRRNHIYFQKRNEQKFALNSIYQKNIVKKAFKSFLRFKTIRMSHQQCLQAIEQKIINPKQISYAFDRILSCKLTKDSSKMIFCCLQRAKMRLTFEKCFSHDKNIILRLKQMEKINQLKKLGLIFQMLKNNQEYNKNKTEQIRKNVIAKILKQRFIFRFKQKYIHQKQNSKLFQYIKVQRRNQFVENLVGKNQQQRIFSQKQSQLQKYLAFSLFKTKLQQQREQIKIQFQKNTQLQKYLNVNKIGYFINSLNQNKELNLRDDKKIAQLQMAMKKAKINNLQKKIQYEKKHNPSQIQSKINKIFTLINHSSFYTKFQQYSKQKYLTRWMDWKKKSLIFQKLQTQKQIKTNEKNLMKKLQILQISNAWNQIKTNIQTQKQILIRKQEEIYEFLDFKRQKQIGKIVNKFYSVKQTSQNYNKLKNSIKLKYFSKFMRNSLVTKYEKVKQFCAIKSYARNLKQKSWNGLKIMLMRLRDKQNKIKTEQQLIVKIDKAMYQSRKSNRLSQTIQRFNSSVKNASLSRPVR